MSISIEETIGRLYESLRHQIAKVIVGQDEVIEHILIALFAGGHVLIEGIPGTAKTLLVRVLAALLKCSFRRIQFTPDLMPVDVIGTSIYLAEKQTFQFRPGPVFAQLVLCDEINRAPAKTQSALLEAMQERQVTVDGQTYKLPELFTVLATQNPIEHEGTYPLPEAQLDRFMMKILVDYPSEEQEVGILRLHQQGQSYDDLSRFQIQVAGGPADVKQAQDEIRGRTIRDELLAYIARIVRTTRDHPKVEIGASPRSGLMILMAAKARAALQGRGHVLPDDVKAIVKPVLRHRIILRPSVQVDGYTADDVLDDILVRAEVPR